MIYCRINSEVEKKVELKLIQLKRSTPTLYFTKFNVSPLVLSPTYSRISAGQSIQKKFLAPIVFLSQINQNYVCSMAICILFLKSPIIGQQITAVSLFLRANNQQL